MSWRGSRQPLVTVYVPCRNYGRYLRGALESVRAQTYPNWELIVVDDGSTDETPEIMRGLASWNRLRTHRNETPRGLRTVANMCFMEARGEFVLRLDADDVLHPRALEMLAAEIEDGVDLVFPDYFYTDEIGRVIGVESLPSVDGRYEASSFPPHGACSLVRRSLVTRFGGYDEELTSQDGHELWLRALLSGAEVRHVSLPLFYYRQHEGSLSQDQTQLLSDRAIIKHRMREAVPTHRVIGILTVCDTNPQFPNIAFTPFDGGLLVERELEQVLGVEDFDEFVVTTDGAQVAEYVRDRFPTVTVIERAEHLRHHDAKMREVLSEVVARLALPSLTALCVLSLHTPFRRADHIRDALNNFLLYEVDSVVSVHEEQNLVYQLGPYGLEPVNPSWQYLLRKEREAVYVENSAVRMLPAANLRDERFLGLRIGHVLMTREDGFKINTPADLRRLAAPVHSASVLPT
jgi:CMP-N-acetylneuraminic acid synthetase/GT2 family glycosyltransferase